MINRQIWLIERVSRNSKPNWPCPTCGIGELVYKDNWAKSEPDSQTGSQKENIQFFFNDARKEHFAGILICSNQQCKESVSTCGYLIRRNAFDFDVNGGLQKLPGEFYHQFFYPALNIFQISDHCPPIIKKQIEKSFSHYFNDLAACSNALRISLELIMNDQKINKSFVTANRKRKYYVLHERINIFGKIHSELKPFLFAAKWIGNAGSHEGEISKEALLDGYELLEYCIHELYERKETGKFLTKKAKAINKRKKPVN